MRTAEAQTPYSWVVANNKKGRAASPDPEPVPISRVQRSLLYMAGSILGLGVVAIFAILIGDLVNEKAIQDNLGLWPVVEFLPLPAIALGFLLFIALIAVTFVTRSRAAKDAGK